MYGICGCWCGNIAFVWSSIAELWIGKKTELLVQQRELLTKYYEGLQERFKESQKLLHDVKKHLQVISDLGDNEKTTQKEYAKELLEEIEEIQKISIVQIRLYVRFYGIRYKYATMMESN